MLGGYTATKTLKKQSNKSISYYAVLLLLQHKNKSMATNDSHQGSFLNGFTLGLFAGAAGYFLFGTPKGESVRKKMSQEWEYAKKHLAEQGVIESSNMTIRDLLRTCVEQLAATTTPQHKQQLKPQQKQAKSSKSTTDSSASTTATKRRLFKNT